MAIPTANADTIDISVVFATRNRGVQLAETLAAYRTLNTRGLRWELLVVDNDSQDDTAAVLASARACLPLTVLTAARPGQNHARNKAMSLLRGELVVFTDDDVLPDPECLRAYQEAAGRWPADIIFGARIDPRFPPGTPAWLRSPRFVFGATAFARYAPADRECRVKRHPYGPSFMVRRRAIGDQRFDTQLGPRQGGYAMGGEGEFLRRLAGRRYGYVYVPQARVQHVVRRDQLSADWLLSRAEKKGRGQVYLPSDKKPRKRYIAGVPIRLWLATARAGLRFHAIGIFSGERRRILLGIQYRLRLGELKELLQRAGNASP